VTVNGHRVLSLVEFSRDRAHYCLRISTIAGIPRGSRQAADYLVRTAGQHL